MCLAKFRLYMTNVVVKLTMIWLFVHDGLRGDFINTIYGLIKIANIYSNLYRVGDFLTFKLG